MPAPMAMGQALPSGRLGPCVNQKPKYHFMNKGIATDTEISCLTELHLKNDYISKSWVLDSIPKSPFYKSKLRLIFSIHTMMSAWWCQSNPNIWNDRSEKCFSRYTLRLYFKDIAIISKTNIFRLWFCLLSPGLKPGGGEELRGWIQYVTIKYVWRYLMGSCKCSTFHRCTQ